jgi:L-ascorbate metabolism protein UlaG (beta-lactamase superfamily)
VSHGHCLNRLNRTPPPVEDSVESSRTWKEGAIVRIRYLAHSCFLITASDGTRILTDPYEAGGYDGAIGYAPINEAADVVVVTHEHADHAAVSEVRGNPLVIRRPARARGVSFDVLEVPHDDAEGAKRGTVRVFRFTVDDIRLCHASDLGRPLTEAERDSLGKIDVLFVPVGGRYTLDAEGANTVIDQLSPRVAIPMHYSTPRIGFPLDPVEKFLEGRKNARRPGRSEIEIPPNGLPRSLQVLVLEPDH